MGTRKTDRSNVTLASIVGVYCVFALLSMIVISTEGSTRKDVVYISLDTTKIPDGYRRAPLSYSTEDVYFLAEAIYFEARGESPECREQVANVIVSRYYSHRFPNTIKGVVWQAKQFSYTHDGKVEAMDDWMSRMRAQEIAHYVLSGKSLDKTGGSLFYYNPHLASPDWAKDMKLMYTCGNHIFLSDETESDEWK